MGWDPPSPCIPLPQHPSWGLLGVGGVAGRENRVPTTAWPYCHSGGTIPGTPLPHPAQLWVRQHPQDPLPDPEGGAPSLEPPVSDHSAVPMGGTHTLGFPCAHPTAMDVTSSAAPKFPALVSAGVGVLE